MAILPREVPKEYDGNGNYVDNADYVITRAKWDTIKNPATMNYNPSGLMIKVRLFEQPWIHTSK